MSLTCYAIMAVMSYIITLYVSYTNLFITLYFSQIVINVNFVTSKMDSKDWLVVGIAGATCSGKSLLAEALHKKIPNSVLIQQDSYFLPQDDPRQVKVPGTNFMNWEILSSLDVERMHADVEKAMNSCTENNSNKTTSKRVLLLDGFILLSDKTLTDMCDLTYFMTIPKEESRKRRSKRTYDPPDLPGYFDKVVWPEYIKHEASVRQDKKLCEKLKFIDGTGNKDEIFDMVYAEIKKNLS